MTIPAHRKDSNIKRSVYKHLHEAFVVPQSLQNAVSYDDAEFDSSGKDAWVWFTFVEHMAGKKGSSMLQADVCVRERGKISGGDRYAVTCDTLTDTLVEAMHVDVVQLFDFAVPALPVVLVGRRAMVQTSGGTFREPEGFRSWEVENGVARRTVTWRLVLAEDLDGLRSFYD